MLAPQTALAQHQVRSAGHADTWHGDVRSYASWADYRGGYYGHHRDWDRGSRWGYAGWGYPYYGWASPYYSSGTGLYGAYYPYYSSSLDTGYYYSMYAPVYDYGYFPNYGYRSSVTTVADDTAHIIVYVPDPDAEVWFDGRAISSPARSTTSNCQRLRRFATTSTKSAPAGPRAAKRLTEPSESMCKPATR